MKNKPNLFIVGGARCGTTSIYNYLNQHESIFFPLLKEPRFFLREYYKDEYYKNIRNKSIKNLDDYLRLYKNQNEYKYYGDASPHYLAAYESAKQIKSFNPDAKIIIIIRNPIKRAFSNYRLRRNNKREFLNFKEALEYELKYMNDFRLGSRHYIRDGMYYRGIKEYKEIFGENCLVLLHDELVENSYYIVNKILNFLRVKNFNSINTNFISQQTNINSESLIYKIIKNKKSRLISKYLGKITKQVIKSFIYKKLIYKKHEMTAVEKKILHEVFDPEIIKLQKLINKDLNHWLSS